MPRIEIRNLAQYAVLWIIYTKGNYGEYTVSSPIEISVRWEEMRSITGDPQNTVESNVPEVFIDREILIGSILWKGRLTDLPDTPTKLYKVTEYDCTPDIKGRVYQRSVTLTRYREALPTVVS